VVGAHVARRLGMDLDVVISCKIPAPGHPDLSMGAVAEGGVRHIDVGLASVLQVAPGELRGSVRAAEEELLRRVRTYRMDRPLPDLRGRVAFLVDDGIARGVSARAAVEAVRRLRPDRLVVATPVASAFAAEALAGSADAVVALIRPAVLRSVSEWYGEFSPLQDSDVVAWLGSVPRRHEDAHATA